jgi:hypothetical protein
MPALSMKTPGVCSSAVISRDDAVDVRGRQVRSDQVKAGVSVVLGNDRCGIWGTLVARKAASGTLPLGTKRRISLLFAAGPTWIILRSGIDLFTSPLSRAPAPECGFGMPVSTVNAIPILIFSIQSGLTPNSP